MRRPISLAYLIGFGLINAVAFVNVGCDSCDDDDDAPPPLTLVPERRVTDEPGTWVLVAAPGGFSSGPLSNCKELTPIGGERWYNCIFTQSSPVNTLPLQFYDPTRCQRQNWRPRLVEPNPNILLQEREPGHGCERGWELRLLRR